MKRFFDFVLSLTALIIIFLPLTIIYLLVLITSSRPVIYWSKRVGKNNKLFMMPKFRTMKKHTPELPTDKLIKPEQWWTPLGKILRKTSLDELPQLINIIKMDMSLIGPRPIVVDEVNKYGDDISKVFSIRPGISGLWQVSGRNKLTYKRRVEIDVIYADNYCLLMDLRIILRTIGVIFFPKDNDEYY